MIKHIPLLCAVVGVFVGVFVGAELIDVSDVSVEVKPKPYMIQPYLLSSLVGLGSILAGFTGVATSIFLSNNSYFIKELKVTGYFSDLLKIVKLTVTSSISIVILSIIGFLLPEELLPYYYWLLFSFVGLSVGYFFKVFYLLIDVGLMDAAKEKNAAKRESSNHLSSRAHEEEANKMIKQNHLTSEHYKQETESMLLSNKTS